MQRKFTMKAYSIEPQSLSSLLEIDPNTRSVCTVYKATENVLRNRARDQREDDRIASFPLMQCRMILCRSTRRSINKTKLIFGLQCK